ncbi:hypothetical protein Pmani_022959 [Petrolisthes manimaculis]|nr:hypothetical protein Pmani_022959 [Petrolisthes manimaculis]
MHVPGKTIPAADATSQYPSTTDENDEANVVNALSTVRIPASTNDDLENLVVATAKSSTDSLGAVTWCRVKECTSTDNEL